eukprot:scaffold343744_cov15-Prasinocladus_malaysianus.AAC.1
MVCKSQDVNRSGQAIQSHTGDDVLALVAFTAFSQGPQVFKLKSQKYAMTNRIRMFLVTTSDYCTRMEYWYGALGHEN